MGETTDRGGELAGGGGVIWHTGTGLLKFTGDFTATDAGSKLLGLIIFPTGPTTAGTGELAGVIADNGVTNKISIYVGLGVWKLSAANSSYSGDTNIISDVLNAATFADYGQNSSLGNRPVGGDTVGNVGLEFFRGTLQYSGTTPQSTNRALHMFNGTSTPPVPMPPSNRSLSARPLRP